MRRPSFVRAVLLVIATPSLVCTVGACIASQIVDVGYDIDAAAPGSDADASSADEPRVEAAVETDDAADGPVDSSVQDADSGPTAPIEGFCIPNPSFELGPADDGGSASAAMPVLAAPDDWKSCNGSTGSSASNCGLSPTQGSTYLGLSLGFTPLFLGGPASVDVVPCSALEAGVTYSVSVDVAFDAPEADGGQTGEPPALQLRGSDTVCDSQADLLWRFSGLSDSCGWKTLCGTFTPRVSYAHLVLIPETSASTSAAFSQTNLLVDNLRSGGACSTR